MPPSAVRLSGWRIRGMGPFEREVAVDLDALGPTARIVAIVGENGAGKTTTVELALPGAMWRRTPTRGSLVDLATSDDAFLESRLSVDSVPYTLRHLVSKSSGKSEALVLDGQGQPVLPDSKVRSFDGWASEHMPSAEVFFASCFAPQGAGGFLGAKPTERKEILLRILGPAMAAIEADAAVAREELRDGKARLATLEARIADELGRLPSETTLEPLEPQERSPSGRARAVCQALRRSADEAQQWLEREQALLAETRAELTTAEDQERERVRLAAENAERATLLIQANVDLEAAQAALRGLEERASNNRKVLGSADAIRAAAARLPVLLDELAAVTAELATAEAEVVRHGADQGAHQAAEAKAIQRVERETERVRKAKDARARAAKMPELRAALDAADAEVAELEQRARELRAKDKVGDVERIGLLRSSLEVIADGDADPVGIAQDRLAHDDELVELASTLPVQLREAEGAVAARQTARAALARDVKSGEQAEMVAADLAVAEADLAAAAADAASARSQGQAASAALLAAGNLRSELQTRLQALQVERQGVERQAKFVGPLDQAEAKLAELEPQVARARAEVERLELARGEALTASVPLELPPVPDVLGCRKRAANAEDTVAEANRRIATAQQRLELSEAATTRLVELEQQRQALEADVADWALLAADLGRDGLQAMVIDGAIPEVNRVTNDLLHEAFGSRFTIDVRTQSSDAKGKRLLETLDVWVIDTGDAEHKPREGLAETFSGGEKTILAEALSLALTELSCRQAGADRPTLIRDESAGALSEANAPRWMAMLRRAADIINVDRILFVNHNRATWELADARIPIGSVMEVAA